MLEWFLLPHAMLHTYHYCVGATERPTLMNLMYLSTSEGEGIDIIQESATSYRRIGTILLNDRYGNRVDIIESDMREKGEKIITEVYKEWMKEDPGYSWTTLTDCFRACNLNRLAHDIEQHFGIPSPLENVKGTDLLPFYSNIQSSITNAPSP